MSNGRAYRVCLQPEKVRRRLYEDPEVRKEREKMCEGGKFPRCVNGRAHCVSKRGGAGSEKAVKRDPILWKTAKEKACSVGKLCKHSARKMQWATRFYQSKGGRYVGKKSRRNSLSKWQDQRWRTSSGKRSRGRLRYLPDEAWKKLTREEVRRTNAAKERGFRRGRQYVPQPVDIARKTKRYRG